MLWEASVLDPEEVSNTAHDIFWNTYLSSRVSASTGCPSQTAKRYFQQHPAARKLLRKVCSGFCSRDRYLRKSRPASFRESSLRRANCHLLSRNLSTRASICILPVSTPAIILDDRLPVTLHPMTQLGIAVAALNHDSSFQAAYEKGMKKSEYWSHTLEDCLNLVAKLPALSARIYRNVYRPGSALLPIDRNLDLVGKPGALCPR